MKVKIALASEQGDNDVENIINLKLRMKENLDSAVVKQEEAALNPEDAAAGVLSALLSVIIGKEFLNNLLEIVKEWIKSRPAVIEAKKSKLEIEVEHGEGKVIKIKVENMKDLEEIRKLTESIK